MPPETLEEYVPAEKLPRIDEPPDGEPPPIGEGSTMGRPSTELYAHPDCVLVFHSLSSTTAACAHTGKRMHARTRRINILLTPIVNKGPGQPSADAAGPKTIFNSSPEIRQTLSQPMRQTPFHQPRHYSNPDSSPRFNRLQSTKCLRMWHAYYRESACCQLSS
mgnify:CR=1 FL=1